MDFEVDFEVFLVSQIKEHADAGEDSKRSVVSGLLTSGRVITAAAMIMGFGLGRFDLNGDPTVKPFGIGLAVAVILDAKVVRCLLVLARTASLGKANSYLARRLGQIFPRISIEYEKYFKPAIGSRPQSSSKPTRSWRRGRSRPPPHGRDDCPNSSSRPTPRAGVPGLTIRRAAMPPAEENTDVRQQVITSPIRAPRHPGGHGSPARPGRPPLDLRPAH